jgi:hypothetical protein
VLAAAPTGGALSPFLSTKIEVPLYIRRRIQKGDLITFKCIYVNNNWLAKSQIRYFTVVLRKLLSSSSS